MKVLVTGARGFVGRNLCLALGQMPDVEVLKYDLGDEAMLDAHVAACDFVMHLAGVNRPQNVAEFKTGNAVFAEDVLERLAARPDPPPVLLSSSIQAALDNDYGRSKAAAEEAVRAYGRRTGADVFVYRLANVFGKWCRPNYNSAVATWCHNIARDLPVVVRDPAAAVTLVYIDDVVGSFIGCLGHAGCSDGILSVSPSYTRTLGEIVELIRSFRDEPKTLLVPDQADGFTRKLYATYLAALPEDKFSYPLAMHCDSRGSFTEALHSAERGQVSVNVSRAGVAKGQHWHHTKHEKFLVVSGTGEINFRVADDPDAKVITYRVCGEKLEIVRVPPGYTHNIVNIGDADMVTLMWANEVFDPENPDTFRLDV
jgi:UDP-2-acetamido-2,6-beta-L-arabino-hexul-4-ose reductase